MRAGSALALLFCGCASIYSRESTTTTTLQPSVDHRVVADSMEYTIATEVEGQRISFAIEQHETCATVTTPRTHRRRYVERQADPTMSRATWALAALSLGGGAYGSLNAETLASRSTDPESPTADEYRQYSGGLLVIGVAALTIGVIDAVRASDSQYDDGVIEGRRTREEKVCRRSATANRNVDLRLSNGHQVAGRSDARGNVTFDLSEVPEEGLPGDMTREYLAIGSVQVNVELSRAQRDGIRASLLADPRSRLAMDLLQKRRDACASSVATARDGSSTSDVTRDVLATWELAKKSCGDVWTSSYEAELESVGARVADTECRAGLRAADEAFVNGSEVTVEDMSTALGILRGLCKTPEQITRLGKLDAKLATVVKRIEREAAAEARRVAREEAAALQRTLDQARRQRSVPTPAWPTSETRSCCRVCTTGKACGNSCISRSKSCHKGVGCACDG